MKVYLTSVLLCLCGCIILLSCQESSTLPPKATGLGNNSSNIAALNDIEKQSISSYKNWQFGKKSYAHTKKILDFGPRPIESKGHKKTQQYITSQLELTGWKVTSQKIRTNTPYGKRNFVNLIARRKSSNQSPNIVLAAHYDSKILDGFLGADDAASCVGALLEIAENLPLQDKELSNQIELVFFDGEEALSPNIEYLKDGLYGSIYYSKFMRNDTAGDKKNYTLIPKFGILLDMIGHRNLSIKIPSDTPKKLIRSYYHVVDKHSLENHFAMAQGSILDDHYPMNQIAKLPTIDIIGDFSNKSWWHTTKDDFQNISENSLNISIQVALEIILHQLKN